jgi:hypothetical protein
MLVSRSQSSAASVRVAKLAPSALRDLRRATPVRAKSAAISDELDARLDGTSVAPSLSATAHGRQQGGMEMMGTKLGHASALLGALALLGGAGCGRVDSDVGDDLRAEDDGVAQDTGKLLASLTLEPDHRVDFFEVAPGLLSASESGRLGKHAPRVTAEMKQQSFVEIYRALAPAAEVPAALVEADARRVAVASTAAKDLSAPPEAAALAGAPSEHAAGARTTGEQQWFRQVFCPDATKCLQGWDWADSGWDTAAFWQTTAMVGSEGSRTAPFNGYYWKCDVFTCWWQPFFSSSVTPGYYRQVTTNNDRNFYFKSTLTGAGGDTQVSLAVKARYIID